MAHRHKKVDPLSNLGHRKYDKHAFQSLYRKTDYDVNNKDIIYNTYKIRYKTKAYRKCVNIISISKINKRCLQENIR